MTLIYDLQFYLAMIGNHMRLDNSNIFGHIVWLCDIRGRHSKLNRGYK